MRGHATNLRLRRRAKDFGFVALGSIGFVLLLLPLPYWGEGRGEGQSRELAHGAAPQNKPSPLPRFPLTLTLSPVGERGPEGSAAAAALA